MPTKDGTPFLSNIVKGGEVDQVAPDAMFSSELEKNPYGQGYKRWGLKPQGTDAASKGPSTPDTWPAVAKPPTKKWV